MIEKRKLTRFSLEVPAKVDVVASRDKSHTLDLCTSNICAGGAFFPTGQKLPRGTDVRLALKLPLDRLRDLVDFRGVRVNVEGTVVRSGSEGMAIRFSKNYQIVPG
jgi:hypothetical protein